MKSKYSRYLVLVAVLLMAGIALLAAACGGSDDTTVTTAAPTDTTAATTEGTDGALEVKGLVDNPLNLTLADLQAMNVTTITVEHPKDGPTGYTGVLLSDLIAAAGVQSGATLLDMAASDGFIGEVTLAELDLAATMIAIGDDGSLRAVMPGQSSKAWVKDVISLEFK